MPTIIDVAKIARVSKSTVSRVLNNSAKISDKTKKRVLKAVAKLNYERNNIARSLTKKKTNTIGVVLEDIVNPFFTEVAKGIETALTRSDYTMILTSSDYIYENEVRLTRMLLQYKVDGLLITPLNSESEGINLLRMRKVPFFIMNNKSHDGDVSWIDSDNLEGGYIATRYLLELGHRRFLCIRSMLLQGTRDRFVGFKKALQEANIKVSQQVVLGDARSTPDGHRIVNNYIEENGKKNFPSAVVAVNDAVAIGAMEALIENGMKVPDDVSIIGYDDINIAALVRVPLTTVHQLKFKMGEIAATQLIDKIERSEEGIARQFLVKPKLIIRKSCREYPYEK